MTEFDEWAERIIQGAMLPSTKDSQQFALASMIKTLGPTEFAKEDVYFIQCLRKGASNQIAEAKMAELYASKQKRAEEEKAQKASQDGIKTVNM